MAVADSLFFFFSSRRRHTRSDRDWSSDVCSSDLNVEGIDSYLARQRTQLPVIGPAGQERLRKARAHISGTGRIGTSHAMHLAAARSGERRVGEEWRSRGWPYY